MWQIATKAHYGNEHFAIIPEDLVDIILRFTAQEGDYVLDMCWIRLQAGARLA